MAPATRPFGEKKFDRVNHVLRQAFWLTIGISIGVAIFGNLAAPFLLKMLGASTTTADLALEYLRPLLLGTIFFTTS
ncbi:MAG: hypothetical protein GY822_22055 [Deltaproteobacteria bacterium]|nr:hypothetical protein [Deltaproteobacteria bacterium]